MDSDSPQLPFTWKQIKSRVYKEKNRQLKPLRVIVFHLERYFEIVLYIGGLEKYEDFLHFHFQAMRINRPEPDEGEIFDGIVAEGWTGMPRYFSPAQR